MPVPNPAINPPVFHLPTLFTVVAPPVIVNFPPTMISVVAAKGETASAYTVSFVPVPIAVQPDPVHLASRRAALPPAVVNPPPAHKLAGVKPSTTALTCPFIPIANDDQVVPFHCAI